MSINWITIKEAFMIYIQEGGTLTVELYSVNISTEGLVEIESLGLSSVFCMIIL